MATHLRQPDQDWVNRKQDLLTARRADKVEFRALKESTSPLGEALRNEKRFGSLREDLEDVDGGRFFRRSKSEDLLIAEVSRELQRRAQLLGGAWPFELDDDGLTLRSRENTPSLIYEFCLAVAQAPSITEGDYKVLPENFERACLSMLQHWLGHHANGIRTGWPRDEGLPSDPKDLFDEVSKRVGRREWVWAPSQTLNLPENPSSKYLKESKLDLLAWIEMPDTYGHVYFAGQCACSFNDMEDKARELTVGWLARWFAHPMCLVDMVRCFFVPFHLPPHRLSEIITLGGATFDRGRMAMVAKNLPEAETKRLKKALQPAVNLVVSC